MIARLIAAPFWWVTGWLFNWRKHLDEKAAHHEDYVRSRYGPPDLLTNIPGAVIRIPRRPTP